MKILIDRILFVGTVKSVAIIQDMKLEGDDLLLNIEESK
jgi:hypothetical protein